MIGQEGSDCRKDGMRVAERYSASPCYWATSVNEGIIKLECVPLIGSFDHGVLLYCHPLPIVITREEYWTHMRFPESDWALIPRQDMFDDHGEKSGIFLKSAL